MSRRLRVKTLEMGDLELYLIYASSEGVWESDWEPLRGTPITELLTRMSKEDMDHCLAGWSWPLTSKLGIPPQGALLKLVPNQCFQREGCALYARKLCTARSKEIRLCFELEGAREFAVRKLATDVVRLWSEGVYVLIILEEELP